MSKILSEEDGDTIMNDGFDDEPMFPPSPTENTEELDLVELVLKANELIMQGKFFDIDGDTQEGTALIDDYKERIAHSNHQAVQAFGEKVLARKGVIATGVNGRGVTQFTDVVPVSVITSLMKGEVK